MVKGFAVVAAETRELAAISTSYADAIREVVSNIQESIEKVEKNIKSVTFDNSVFKFRRCYYE